MTITINTDPIVATTSLLAYHYPKALITNKVTAIKENRKERKYERMIKKSQKKIGPYIP